VPTSPDSVGRADEIAALHGRVHLDDVRLQRLQGETVGDPPFAVAQVVVSAAAPEVAVEAHGFSCRLTYRVALLDPDEWDLGAIELALILDYRVNGGIPTRDVIAAYVDEYAIRVALPYVRETIHTTTSRLGIALVLGVLNESDVLPTEVHLQGDTTRLTS
jgi:hypothetical protein